MDTAQEVGALERNVDSIGLGEYVDQVTAKPRQVPISQIICDGQNKAIICRNRWSDHIAKSFNELTGNTIEAFRLTNESGAVVVFTSYQVLSIPDRHTLALMTKYFDSRNPGFAAVGKYVYLPSAMTPYSVPVQFETEDDAFEVAEVLTVLTNLKSDVIKTAGGYAVTLLDTIGDLNEWVALQVVGAIEVLKEFHCTRRENRYFDISQSDEADEAWQRNSGR